MEELLRKLNEGSVVTLTVPITEPIRLKGHLLRGKTIRAGELPMAMLYPAGSVEGLTIEGGVWQGIRLDGVKKLKVIKARFQGPEVPNGTGLKILGGEDLLIQDNVFESYKEGIALSRVTGFDIRGCAFSRMRSDGMTIGESRQGLIEGNRFHGTKILKDEHPDFIQLYSRPTSPPTSDIIIRRNRGIGPSQGICGFNHERKGVDDGGFDRIVIEDNYLCCGFPHGIALVSARDSHILNNYIETYPLSKYRASINAEGVMRSGNFVAAGAGKPEVKDVA